MFDLTAWFAGLGIIVVLAVLTWGLSLKVRDASIVDSLWSLLFLAAAITYAVVTDAETGPRTWLTLALVTIWSLRLSGFITWRNWGEGEDLRYQAMRRRQGPKFPMKSLVTVFLLQGVIAWIVSLPLVSAMDGSDDLGPLAVLAVLIWIVGFAFEAGGDAQLTKFKADPANAGVVMDKGFWRYTRHPNYFGDATQWWAFWLLALGAGGWWTAIGPAVMTVMLLRVSGVALLERRMAKTRPKYQEYVARTNAFIPGRPKRA